MKKILFIFIFLSSIKTFSQEYHDKIIKKNNDTIVCRITLINKSFIFYHINKSGDKTMSLWLNEISSIYLAPESKPKIDFSKLNFIVDSNKYITLEIETTAPSNDFNEPQHGFYISLGLGGGTVQDWKEAGYALSGAYAFKSNIITLTATGFATIDIFGPYDDHSTMHANNVGLTFGEGLRRKNVFFSASIGLAYTEYALNNYFKTAPFSGVYDINQYAGISIPIELKAFIFFAQYVGLGIHYSVYLTPNYCPTMFSISLMIDVLNTK